MNDSSQVQFAPFATINQFMLPEYRQIVIEVVLKQVATLPTTRRLTINNMFRRYVKIAGFRNSDLAPVAVKIKQAGPAFERHSDFAAQILSAWSELKGELRQQVYDLLKARNWELLPVETERAKLPGFLVQWPKQETYDELNAAFTQMYPGHTASDDDVRLMIVWLGGRLPFDMMDAEEEQPA